MSLTSVLFLQRLQSLLQRLDASLLLLDDLGQYGDEVHRGYAPAGTSLRDSKIHGVPLHHAANRI